MEPEEIIERLEVLQMACEDGKKNAEHYKICGNSYRKQLLIVRDDEAEFFAETRALIKKQAMEIAVQHEEITNLRKKIVKASEDVDDAIEQLKDTRKQYEELRDKHTRLVGQIMNLMEKIGR